MITFTKCNFHELGMTLQTCVCSDCTNVYDVPVLKAEESIVHSIFKDISGINSEPTLSLELMKLLTEDSKKRDP